jgi:ssDNA-binding Zn-finger/Zn-ribbon topoisomerase 1
VEYNKIPFNSEEKDEMIDFICKKCGYEEQVPDFVAFECYTPEEFDKETGSPIVLCPKCDGDMIMKKV